MLTFRHMRWLPLLFVAAVLPTAVACTAESGADGAVDVGKLLPSRPGAGDGIDVSPDPARPAEVARGTADVEPLTMPSSPPLRCDGATFDSPTTLVRVPTVVPALRPFRLGDAYPFAAAAAPVTTGTLLWQPGVLTATYRSTAKSGVHRAGIASASVLDLGPRLDAGRGHAYVGGADLDELPTSAWARAARTPDNALSFFVATRVDRTEARLSGEVSPRVPYAAASRQTRYAGFALHLVFRSRCDREQALLLAGDTTLDALLPPEPGALARAYVSAGVEIRIHAIALGPAAEADALLDATACSTERTGACADLVRSFTALASKVASADAPAAFDARSDGNNGWFADSVTLKD